MSKSKKERLTRLVLSTLLLGSGPLGGVTAEAGEVIVNNSMTTAESLQYPGGAGLAQTTIDEQNYWYIHWNKTGAGTKTLTINSLSSGWNTYGFAAMMRNGGTTADGFKDTVVTLKNGTVKHLQGSYVINNTGIGNVENNKVFLSTGGIVTNNIHAGHTSKGDAIGNEVEISSNGSVGGFVRAGTTVDGLAKDNKVTVKGSGSVDKYVYAGYSMSGNATNNIVNVNGGSITGVVRGGEAGSGSATNGSATGNIINITAGTTGHATGGHVNDNGIGDAIGNKVNVSGGTVAGITGGGISTNATGNAQSNVVTITKDTATGTKGTVTGDIKGGNVIGTGNAGGASKELGNQVNISDGTIGGNVYGGITGTGSAGNSNYNAVTIGGGKVGKDDVATTGFIYGGYSENGVANFNTVEIKGGEITGDVNGGKANKAGTNKMYHALNNTVTISDGTVKGNVRGGIGGDAGGNKVFISGGIIGTSTADNVLGGHAGYATGEASNNIVKVSGGTVEGWIAAGNADGGAQTVQSNTVEISKGTVNSHVLGGRSVGSGGNATKNGVSISGDTTVINGNIYGAQTYSDATQNTVTMEGGKVAGANGLNGGWVTTSGNANNNTVTMSGGEVTKAIRGGRSYGENSTANYNTVEISGADTKVGTTVMDGIAFGTGTTVDHNTITMQAGTVGGMLYGGYTETGTATNNTVEMTGGVVIGENEDHSRQYGINGGWIETTGNATNNTVTISGGESKRTIRGGRSHGDNSHADNNKVTISGDAIIDAGVMGGRGIGSDAVANSNTVTINGGKFGETSNIYGGYGDATANNNTVNINAAVTVYGIAVGNAPTSSGNTLNLGSSGITVGAGGVANTQTINIGYTDTASTLHTVAFENGAKVLSSTGAISGVETLDISADAAKLAEATTAGNMRLLSGGDGTNFSTLNLKYSSAAAAAIPDAGTKVKESTASDAKDGVVLGYTNTHTVKRADTNKAIDYTITNTVNAVTPGEIAWSAGGTARALTTAEQANYTFNGDTGIDASGMTFTGTSTVNPLNQSMTLLSGASGITDGHITQPGEGKGEVAVAYADGKGVKLYATAKGAVSVASSDVKYTINSVVLNTVDLLNWNGTADEMPENWTGNSEGVIVAAGNFAVPTDLAVGEHRNIFETSTEGFFGEVSGDREYDSKTFQNKENGVTFSGDHFGGVKITEQGKNLTYYAETLDTNVITLGAMTWGVGRTAASGYDFRNVGNISATDLKFDFTDAQKAALSKGSQMTLVSNATNLAADKTVTNKDRTQEIGYTAANGTALTGTLTGVVSTGAGAVNYKASSMTLDKVNLAGWNGAASAVPTGWTANLAADSITAAGFTAPTIDAGTEKDILTTSTDNYFNDNQVAGDMKYKAGASSQDKAAGVTLTGAESKGVKASADGHNLVYARSNFNVSDISMGEMEWNKGRTMPAKGYAFDDAVTVDASDLSFTFTNVDTAALASGSKMALLSGATNLAGKAVTGADRSQTVDYSAANGTALAGTLKGTVSTTATGVNYEATSMTLDKVNLAGWNGAASAVPTGWTANLAADSITAAGFIAPTIDAGTEKDILTTSTDQYFNNDQITGDMKYKAGESSHDKADGVILTGAEYSGVKASADGHNLVYARSNYTVGDISMEEMEWNKGRALPAKGYDFGDVVTVDASKLSFTFTNTDKAALAKGSKMSLLSGGSKLAGATVKGADRSQTVDYSTANGAALTGTLTGTVSTTDNAVNYEATGMTLDKVNLAGWNGTVSAIPTGWTAAAGLSITGSGFTAPTVTLGSSTNIITTDTEGYFAGASIDESLIGQKAAYSKTEKNVTISGNALGSVGADGKNLVYSYDKAAIDTIAVGQVTYDKGATLVDGSNQMYDYSGVKAIDTSGFSVTMTDDQAKAAQVNDSMTILKGNNTLSDISSTSGSTTGYSYSPNKGITVDAEVTGSVAATGGNVNYTITQKQVSNLIFGDVLWNSTYARPDTEALYTGALVNAEKISFSGVESLATGSEMLLVSNYGDSFRKSRGDSFTLGTLSGKGHAYWNSTDKGLYYVIEKGTTTEPAPDVPATGGKETIDDGGTTTQDVVGGKAEGKGDATKNEVDVSNKSTVKVNEDGTGGDVTGGSSEGGKSEGNKATVSGGSEVEGSVIGGKTDSGDATNNEADVKEGSVIGSKEGGVIGGKTDSGESKENKANVENSTVQGSVGGADSNSGGVEKNEANVTEGSIVKPNETYGDTSADVYGASTKTGNAKENTANVEGSQVVKGDVTGGRSESGNTEQNTANVKGGSTVTGDVTGGQTEKGNATKNQANVDGTNTAVTGNVLGAKTESGQAEGNTATTKGGSTVSGNVIGATTTSGSGKENKASVEKSTVNGSVGGASSESGSVEKNEASVKDGSTIKPNEAAGVSSADVYGAVTKTGTAKENTASVEGSQVVKGDVTGGRSESGNTEQNVANVKGSSNVTGNVMGGQTGQGSATKNQANVEGSSTVTGNVLGARTESGQAEGNTATAKGSTVNGSVLGAQTDSGQADGNTATAQGSTVTGSVVGASTKSGQLESNTASVTDNSVITDGNVIGGQTEQGKAVSNKATVDGSSKVTGAVMGARSVGGDVAGNEAGIASGTIKGDVAGAVTNTGSAEGNTATVKGSSTVEGNVTGGQTTSGTATQNEVSVTDTAGITGEVAGAVTDSGQASTNTATLNGGTITGSMAGARSESGAVSQNTVNTTGGAVTRNVMGGYSVSGAVTGNAVSVNKTAVGTDTTDGNIYGGKTDGAEAADTNTVTLDGGATVQGGVYGGYSGNGTAENNVVTIKKATVRDYIYGGKSRNKSANDEVYFEDGSVLGIIGGGCAEAVSNKAEMTDGTVKEHVIGGFADATAKDNSVTMTGGKVSGSVIGGYGGTTEASGNIVNLSGGIVEGKDINSTVLGVEIKGGVYGGYSQSGVTSNNTVNLYGTADISATSLIGGNMGATGNVLNIGTVLQDGTKTAWTGGDGGQNVRNISNFETINFNVVPWSETTAAIKVSAGDNSDLSMTSVGAEKVAFTGTGALTEGSTMTLLDQSSAAKKADSVKAESTYTAGTVGEGTGTLSLDENSNVIYKVTSSKASEQTHNTVMNNAMGMTVLSTGNEFIGATIEGLARPENMGDDGIAVFAKLGGGKMSQDTGSHVDTHTWNAILAFGTKNDKAKSSFEYGGFLEYGIGSYATFNGDNRGDGDARYAGGGFLSKWQKKDGMYVEGSLRTGTIHSDARNLLWDGLGNPYSYETDSSYWGFHVGFGKEFTVNRKDTLDLYAKYFYNHRGSVSFDAGGHYDLDAVNSKVLRLGTRYTMKHDKWSVYGGIAIDHEFGGEAAGLANGVAIRSADIGGTSFRGEIGATVKPDANVPVTVDINLTGFAGKKRGLSGGVAVAWHF